MTGNPITDKSDLLRSAGETIAFAMKVKKRMVDRSLVRARKTCPACGGVVHAVLAGPRNHIHMACENEACHMRVME